MSFMKDPFLSCFWLFFFQKQDIFGELKAQQDKHLFHIKQLETIMRMVDNDALPLEQVTL